MATEQITYAEEQAELPNALADTEIARLMKLVSDSGYKKSENAPTLHKEAFKPRSLVEIAMEVQQKREQKEKQTKELAELAQNASHPTDENKLDTRNDGSAVKTENIKPEFSNISDEYISSVSQSKNVQSDILPPSNEDVAKELDAQPVKAEDNPEQTNTAENLDINANPENNIAVELSDQLDSNRSADSLTNEDEANDEIAKADEIKKINFDEGFDEGLKAGKLTMKAELEQKFNEQKNTFDALITSLTQMSFADTKQLESDIQSAIVELAAERAGIAITEMPEMFITRIETLINRLGSSVDTPIIRLNKADLNHIKTARKQSEILTKSRLIEDPDFNHGDIAISLAGIEIQDILKNRTSLSEVSPISGQAHLDVTEETNQPETLKDDQIKTEQPLQDDSVEKTSSDETS
jgi:flagellar biosynthesis/type III secretory pathway protein FliH